ncbi:hypothetical protein GCM10012275_09020 [Longimycelium tulufanense]|uniref:PKD domain-containing protein n=1 Tax=Longimycelium tulufanense TaxID=907463 RepID=A0A8J3C6F5_9PSEU|nr:PKD domain-containing protein [Longimycelium tulufanense]GGM40229.1 hypothetical protein GCM10012275_09020 [Longimycelium tulufanense]
MKLRMLRRLAPRWTRITAGTSAVTTLLAAIIVIGADHGYRAPQIRLHAGIAWLASNKVGQLTLLDGASAEVMARVPVAAPNSSLHAMQQGTTGYALNRSDGSVVRVDGATLEPTKSAALVIGSPDQLAVFPTPDALYAVDTQRGLLAKTDPRDLVPQGTPYPLNAQIAAEGTVTDPDGRLWLLDRRTGDLVWLSGGTRHARAGAATPGGSRLTLTKGQPALLDPTRRTVELLDVVTGAVQESLTLDIRPDDSVAVSGSPGQRRLLVAVGSRGLLIVCAFTAASCADPIALGTGGGDFGAAVEAKNHAVVPDHATGRVWIVDLGQMRVVADRQLFSPNVRFELVSRDGVIFYNDPNGERAGVLELDGRIRPVTKYDPGRSDNGTIQVPGGNTPEPGPAGPPNPVPTGPPDKVPPVVGSGATETQPEPPESTPVSIVVRPRDHGVVGEEFEFTVVPEGAAGVTSARWNFGDGTETVGTTVRHRWEHAGNYLVSVAAQLTTGRLAYAAARVGIDSPAAPPRIARLHVQPATPQVGQKVRFSAELVGGRPQTWDWTVVGERGTETTSNESVFQHVFTGPGSYTVTLTVTAGTSSHQKSKDFTVALEQPDVRCGDAVTHSVTLSEDLRCTGEAAALRIVASDVDLDLNGHTIATDMPSSTGVGILVEGDALKDINIRNGAIARYPTGVKVVGASGVDIADVEISALSRETSGFPLVGERARDVRVRASTVNAFHLFHFDHGSSVVITGSTLRGNEWRGVGKCAGESSCTVQGGILQAGSITCFGGDMEVVSSSVNVVSTENLHLRSLGPYCRTGTLKNSKITRLDDMSAKHSVMTGNDLDLTREFSTSFWKSFVVSDNIFRGSKGSGVIVFGGSGVLTRNKFVQNGWHGLYVAPMSAGVVGPLEISHNQFVSNGHAGNEIRREDGLHVSDVGAGSVIVVSHNHTENNAAYGINANPGVVVDGGGNTSVGNPQGCRGVRCG